MECTGSEEATPGGGISDLDPSVLEAKDIMSDQGSDMTISSASEA